MLDARSNTPAIMAIWPTKVKRSKFTYRPFFIIWLAIIFLINSSGGGLLIGEVWAARAPGLTSVGPEQAGGPTPLKDLMADTFDLPRELGYIQESVKVPDSKRTVIHIQDAHCNYAAQKSIAQILNYLNTEYGIYQVNCEGGAKSYDLSPFTSIEKKDVRRKTADYFVKEGLVSAAEYYAVNNPSKVSLWGVEDADLYIKNLKIYRQSLSHKNEVDRYIKSIAYILDNLKRHIYSSELLEFDTNYTKYKDGKLSFKDYMAYLTMAAQKRLIDIKTFPNIYILAQTLEEEEKIDFKRANNQRDLAVDRMKKVLSRSELAQLTAKVGDLKAERISQADFYAYLVKTARSMKLELADYQDLQKYIVYISLYSAVDRTKVAGEIDLLEEKIKDSLYENDTQRELGILSKDLVLTKNIFNISITRDDYTYYKEHIAAFAVSNYASFIDKYAPLYKIQAALDKNAASLDAYREAMGQFYECSLERDQAFIKNIKFTDHDRPNSIIITGGFHTQNLRELFNKEKVSYISIMPKFKNESGYESPYMKRLAGQRTALENVIDTAIPAVLNLQVVELLSELGIMVEGEARMERFQLAVAIVAAINEGRTFILKVDEGVKLEGISDEGEKFVTFSRPEGADWQQQVSLGQPARFDARLTKDGKIIFNASPTEDKQQTTPAPEPGVASGGPIGIIGKPAVDDKGNVLTSGFSYKRDGNIMTISNANMKDVAVEIGDELTPAQVKNIRDSLEKAIGMSDKLKPEDLSALQKMLGSINRVVTLKANENIQGFVLDGTLYISEWLMGQPLVLAVELAAIFDMRGLVDRIDPSGNAQFTQSIRVLTDNMRTGGFNIFLMKATDETIAAQAAIGSDASRKFEKQFGTNMVILYWRNVDELRDRLERMKALLSNPQNKERYPMAFANCMNQEELGAVKAFIGDDKELQDTVAIGKDFKEGEKDQVLLPNEVKVVLVGSSVMNDRRLSRVFARPAAELLGIRKDILRVFESSGIISIDDINKVLGTAIGNINDLTEAQAESIMNKIWDGSLILRCSKVNWKSFDDFKSSQRQLLQSV